MQIAYPAIIHEDENGCWAMFPDVNGCFTDGETLAETIRNASEALGVHLCSLLDQGEGLPSVSDIEAWIPEEECITMVRTDPYHYKKTHML